MFRNREDAGFQLGARLRKRALHDPLVLGIPRGGVVVGAVIARQLKAELDVVLARKLRAPGQSELAAGAISETGQIYLNPDVEDLIGPLDDYMSAERKHQLAEIARRKDLVRKIRPAAEILGRSVIVTDDGIATGSTMVAALQAVRAQRPHELIVAVPVAAPAALPLIARWCDEVVCLLRPNSFFAIGQFYTDFDTVYDEEMVQFLREFAPSRQGAVSHCR